jgi:glycosyltransferase involved in cell wall biosynthesis
MTEPPRLFIDLRMLRHSGIGRYLQNVVPRVLPRLNDCTIQCLAYPKDIERFSWLSEKSGIAIPVQSSIYSPKEQWERIRAAAPHSGIFWCPHYNIPLFWRGRIITTIYDIIPIHPELGFRHPLKRMYAGFLFHQAVKRADHILTISQFTAQELFRHASCDPAKVTVTHLGIDADFFRSPSPGRPRPEPYLLAVGNVKPHKNLGRLLEAFGLLHKEIPHRLVIVGKKEGFITGDLSLDKIQARLGSRVLFTGELSDAELKSNYQHADLFIHPSLYEGFGFPPLEAMAAGCPVLVSTAAALPETCGDAVRYFDPQKPQEIADRIREILGDPSLRRDLIQKGSNWVNRFTWDACAEQTLPVLRSFLSA